MTTYTKTQLDLATTHASHTCTVPPVFFTEELAGRNGMAFFLLVEPHHSRENLARACNWLRMNRDVVSITLLRPPKVKVDVDVDDLGPTIQESYLAYARMANEYMAALPMLDVAGAVNGYKALALAYMGLDEDQLTTIQQINAPLVLQMAGGRLLKHFPEALP